MSKVGEFFEQGRSRFDFSYATALNSVKSSLKRLNTEYLDAVLIHSDGNDLSILEQEGVLDALRELKQQGLIRAHGMSIKTVEGGIRAVEETDIVMAGCNLNYRDEVPVIEAAAAQGKGVLIKKALQSGHIDRQGVAASMEYIFSLPGVSSIIVGTINPVHLRGNVALLEEVLG